MILSCDMNDRWKVDIHHRIPALNHVDRLTTLKILHWNNKFPLTRCTCTWTWNRNITQSANHYVLRFNLAKVMHAYFFPEGLSAQYYTWKWCKSKSVIKRFKLKLNSNSCWNWSPCALFNGVVWNLIKYHSISWYLIWKSGLKCIGAVFLKLAL